MSSGEHADPSWKFSWLTPNSSREIESYDEESFISIYGTIPLSKPTLIIFSPVSKLFLIFELLLFYLISNIVFLVWNYYIIEGDGVIDVAGG